MGTSVIATDARFKRHSWCFVLVQSATCLIGSIPTSYMQLVNRAYLTCRDDPWVTILVTRFSG